MILGLQLNSSNFLTNLRNELRTLIQLPGTPVVLEGTIRYIDAIVVEKNTTMAVAAPDPKNARGVPAIDNQNQKHSTANPDAVIHIDQPVTVRSQLRPVSELPLTNCVDMAPAGRFAIIATKTGLTLIDASAPALSAAHSITRAVGAVGPARVAGHSGAFYTLEASGAHSILEFTNTGQIQLLNTYTEEPWFVASRTLGSMLVQLSPLRGNVSVYQARRTLRYQT